MDVVLQHQQARGEAGEAAADRGGDEIDAPLVDAHEAHDLAILGHGADRRAEERARQEEIERARTQQRDDEGEEPREADEDVADLDDRQTDAEIAEIGAKQQRRETLEKKEKAAGGEKLVDRRRAQDRLDDQQVDQHAQQRYEQDGRGAGEQHGPAIDVGQPVDRVHAEHDELGIGDPHDVDHAEDEVEPERQQCQHAAQQNAVDHRLEEVDVHRQIPI